MHTGIFQSAARRVVCEDVYSNTEIGGLSPRDLMGLSPRDLMTSLGALISSTRRPTPFGSQTRYLMLVLPNEEAPFPSRLKTLMPFP